MDGAAAFTAVYAILIELGALGINRVGVITARRRPGADDDAVMRWPHTGSVALHRVVAAVAISAALLLATVFAVMYHSGPDLGTLAVPILLGVAAISRIASQARAAVRDPS